MLPSAEALVRTPRCKTAMTASRCAWRVATQRRAGRASQPSARAAATSVREWPSSRRRVVRMRKPWACRSYRSVFTGTASARLVLCDRWQRDSWTVRLSGGGDLPYQARKNPPPTPQDARVLLSRARGRREAGAPEEDLSGYESPELLLWCFWRQNSSFGAASAGNAGPPPIAARDGVE